jgi:hypothetical protein
MTMINESALKLVYSSYVNYLEAIKANKLVDLTIVDHSLMCDDFSYCFSQNSLFHHECQKAGIYSLITKTLVENLADLLKGKRCLEVMAGRGRLAHHLNQSGVSVLATDDNSWSLNDLEVTQMSGLDAVHQYYEQMDVLILCWPPMNNDAFEIIKAWGTEKPILVGGEIGGCCADELFDSHFEGDFLDVGYVSFSGIHDSFQWGHFKP